MDREASDRKRLHDAATAKLKSDPALRARCKDRALELVRERMSEGRLPPGLVACGGCGRAHERLDDCAQHRAEVERKLRTVGVPRPLGGLAS